MAEGLTAQEVERAKFAFAIFDFDEVGTVDAFRLGEILRALELRPTCKTLEKWGQTPKRGQKQLTIDDILKIYAEAKVDKEVGNMSDFEEIFKLYDKEGNGTIAQGQLTQMLLFYGEKLEKEEVEEIMKDCLGPVDEDGFTDYMPFMQKVLQGPSEKSGLVSKPRGRPSDS